MSLSAILKQVRKEIQNKKPKQIFWT